MVHRALFGSVERFFGVLIEHYAGAFPLWLAPVQVGLVPISERHQAYAAKVEAALKAAGLRVEVDGRNEKMNAKIRDFANQKTPYILVFGDKEEAAGSGQRPRPRQWRPGLGAAGRLHRQGEGAGRQAVRRNSSHLGCCQTNCHPERRSSVRSSGRMIGVEGPAFKRMANSQFPKPPSASSSLICSPSWIRGSPRLFRAQRHGLPLASSATGSPKKISQQYPSARIE